jgi:hypothetical protein
MMKTLFYANDSFNLKLNTEQSRIEIKGHDMGDSFNQTCPKPPFS